MKFKSAAMVLWLVVNVLLLGKYYIDSIGIRCEPCLPGYYCPPCETRFMKNVWLYTAVWNFTVAGSLVIMISFSKKH